jgi:hypothetical protein
MAQSPFFPRQMPHQTADVSKERLPLIPNLSAQGRWAAFVHPAWALPHHTHAPVPAVRRTATRRRNGFPHSPQEVQVHAGSPSGSAVRLHRTVQLACAPERSAKPGIEVPFASCGTRLACVPVVCRSDVGQLACHWLTRASLKAWSDPVQDVVSKEKPPR